MHLMQFHKNFNSPLEKIVIKISVCFMLQNWFTNIQIPSNSSYYGLLNKDKDAFGTRARKLFFQPESVRDNFFRRNPLRFGFDHIFLLTWI